MSIQSTDDAKPLASDVPTLVHAHWRRFLVQGALMIALGILAAALPVITTLAVEILVGWLFVIGGISALRRSAPQRPLSRRSKEAAPAGAP